MVDVLAAIEEIKSRNMWVGVDLEVVDLASTDAEPTKGVPRGLYVGTAGDVKVDTLAGSEGVTLADLGNGFHPIATTKIYKTGTAALDILWVY